jgi:hypothetical protein
LDWWNNTTANLYNAIGFETIYYRAIALFFLYYNAIKRLVLPVAGGTIATINIGVGATLSTATTTATTATIMNMISNGGTSADIFNNTRVELARSQPVQYTSVERGAALKKFRSSSRR